jgi:hypothetical protein
MARQSLVLNTGLKPDRVTLGPTVTGKHVDVATLGSRGIGYVINVVTTINRRVGNKMVTNGRCIEANGNGVNQIVTKMA